MTLCSCIASSRADCVFGGVRFTSSASSRLAKIGPGEVLELQLAVAFLQQFRTDDIARHQVGRELDALEAERERLGEAAHEQRLGKPRHADEQAMSARKQAHEQQADDRLLADHDLAEFRGDARIDFLHSLRGNIRRLSHFRGEATGAAGVCASRNQAGPFLIVLVILIEAGGRSGKAGCAALDDMD